VAHPGTKAEILAALESNAETLAAYFSSIPANAFFAGDSDHWSPGHHLVHLAQTSAAVERGLRSTELPVHDPARSRSYAEVRDVAFQSLTSTPKDTLLGMGRRVQIEPGATVAGTVTAFLAAGASLRSAFEAWEDDVMDRHAMRHPLIGPLSVREMMLFVIVHERHHLRNVRTRLSG
jgi:DinB superfamily